ncbi:MAG: hypothetical protein JW864_05110 [Spirochaetes bacterium]|nr:hypothetical protein [Spirochaetota bacterium]
MKFDAFFNESEKNILLKGEIITKVFLKHRGTVHTPDSDNKIKIPESIYIDKDISGYELICVEKAFLPCENESGIRIFYEQLNNISGLTKVMYYSRTDEQYRQLITESRKINRPESIKFPESILQPVSRNYFSITDNRFGNLKFKSELYRDGNSLVLKNICIQPMEKYFATINHKYEYRLISFFIYDRKAGGYFLYSINAMRIRSRMILNLGILKPESFGNRIRAYTVYFAGLLGLDWKGRLKAFE